MDAPADLSEYLSSRKSRLPRFRTDGYYCRAARVWAQESDLEKAIKREAHSDFVRGYLCCEEAPSGIAKCRVCGGAISRGDPRIAYPTGDPRGNYGLIAAWLHTKCAASTVQEVYHLYLEERGSRESTPVNSEVEDQLLELHRYACQAKAKSKPKAKAKPKAESRAKAKPKAEPKARTASKRATKRRRVDDEGMVKDEKTSPVSVAAVKRGSRASKSGDTSSFATGSEALLPGACESDEEYMNKLAPETASTVPVMPTHEREHHQEEKGIRSAPTLVEVENGESLTPLKTAKADERIDEKVLDTIERGDKSWRNTLTPEHADLLRFMRKYCIGFIYFTHKRQEKIFIDISSEKKNEEAINPDDFVKRVLTARHPPPQELIVPLLPFQEEGLAWMVHQERGETKGGVLADEMGMGKTVQTIALMLAQRVYGSLHPDAADMAEEEEQPVDSDEGESPQHKNMLKGANLVVAPLAAVLQWEGEIARFTRPGSLNVLVYHGSNRKLLYEEMAKADVVITTYATIENDYRRIVNKHKLKCQYCGRRFLPSQLKQHLLYICGPDAHRTERQALKERKNADATKQAMKSLNIGQSEEFVPTIANVYREIMISAGRHKEAEDLSAAPWLSFKRRRTVSEENPNQTTSANAPAATSDSESLGSPSHADELAAPGARLFKNPDPELNATPATESESSENESGTASMKPPHGGQAARSVPHVPTTEGLVCPVRDQPSFIRRSSVVSLSSDSCEAEVVSLHVNSTRLLLDQTMTPLASLKQVNQVTTAEASARSEDSIPDFSSPLRAKPSWKRSRLVCDDSELEDDDDCLRTPPRQIGSFHMYASESTPPAAPKIEDSSPESGKDSDRRESVEKYNSMTAADRWFHEQDPDGFYKIPVATIRERLKDAGWENVIGLRKSDLIKWIRKELLNLPETGVRTPRMTPAKNIDSDIESPPLSARKRRLSGQFEEATGGRKTRRCSQTDQSNEAKGKSTGQVKSDQKRESNTRVRTQKKNAAKPNGEESGTDSQSSDDGKKRKRNLGGKKGGRRPVEDDDSDDILESSEDEFALSESELSSSSADDNEINSSEEVEEGSPVTAQDSDDSSESVLVVKGPRKKAKGGKPLKGGKRTSKGSSSAMEEEVFSSPKGTRKRKVKPRKKGKGGKGSSPSSDGDDSDSESIVSDSGVGDFNEQKIDLSSSAVHNLRWSRIILDEAHRIKSRTTSTARGVFALRSAGTRWCLTGTPLQNRVSELFSLLRFLRMDPYAYYFCQVRGCECKMLHYNFKDNKYCSECGHTKMQHFCYFNKRIARPIVLYGYSGEGREALRTLKNEVLDSVVLRRTKLERAEDVKLPPLNVLIRREALSREEMDFYEALYKQSKTEFDTYVDKGTLLHNFAHIFDLLSRLRQAVDHPYLIIHGRLASTGEGGEAVIPTRSRTDLETCGICVEDIQAFDQAMSSCGHAFHRLCIKNFIETAPSDAVIGCPVCYTAMTVDLRPALERSPTASASEFTPDVSELSSPPTRMGVRTEPASEECLDADLPHSTPAMPLESSELGESIALAQRAMKIRGIMSKIKVSEFQSSTKMEVLVQELETAFESDSTAKAIVFSQFTTMLELIEFRLRKEGMNCVKLTGSLAMEARHNILTAFNVDPNLKVILISLKAGGEGLNLQIANYIYIMDPWWNPAAEMQAIQRAHRIGQTKPVRAVRFIAENTIEERILQLQEKKQLVFDGTVGDSAAAFQKLNSADLKFLFH